ncbi:uncharacterized protein TRAVEDRAFT_161394 [Trametes versicolor FP-101664 SS1]|uniref:uncharacterized protein n=1 Tax=Trametes versicolor (strain FP-101664) TaxID=717944 RepID=UPI00046244C1|nr:uncharacterized protein TRAVEDRAFT_161394 [Trametes versicolor FP-101664 SS1]EIW63225.1 hypothetical protein TRAVEDRAFT_161394 [Trametes versicolor FP-101664 SS1]
MDADVPLPAPTTTCDAAPSRPSSPSAPAAPFDASTPDTNIILRSSDGIDFHVYKVILAIVSPILKSMFTILDDSDTSPASPQIIPLAENASTLEHVLRLCYPVPRTPITSPDELVATSDAVTKYEMTALRPSLEQDLRALLLSGADPLRIYSVACLCRFDSVAHEAARRTLEKPRHLQPRDAAIPPEFAQLSATVLFALIDYRRRCAEAAAAAVGDGDWMVFGEHPKKVTGFWFGNASNMPVVDGSWAWLACNVDGDASFVSTIRTHGMRVRMWFGLYTEDAMKALLDEPHLKGEAVARPAVLRRALEGADSCSRCRTTAWKDLLDYSHLLAGRIDAAVSNVRLELPF